MNELIKKLKPYFLLATYIIILAYIFLNLGTVGNLFGGVLKILGPFLTAIGIAFVLNIPMKFFERKLLFFIDTSKKFSFLKNFKRPISIILTFLLVIGILTTLIIFIIPQLISSISTLIENVPEYIASLEKIITTNLSGIDGFDQIWIEIMNAWKEVLGFAGQFLGVTLNHIFNLTIDITTVVIDFFLSLVFAVYMLANKESLIFQTKKILYAHLKLKFADKILYIGRISNEIFQKFIAGQCTEAVIIGSLCCIGMLILQLPYAFLIGFIVGVTSLIPIFGAFIGTIPSALLILLIDPIKAFIFIIFIIILQQIEGNFIYPKVVGNSIGLSAIWVMFAMLVGGSTLGFLGLLLGIPMFGVIYKLFRDHTNLKLSQKGLSLTDLNNK